MPPDSSSSQRPPRLTWGAVCVLAGGLFQALFVQGALETPDTATTLVSHGLSFAIIDALGGTIVADGDRLLASIPFGPLFAVLAATGLACWIIGAGWIARRNGYSWRRAAAEWGVFGWLWWLIPGIWEFARIAVVLTGFASVEAFLLATPPMWQAVALAGWLAVFFTLAARGELGARSAERGTGNMDGGDPNSPLRAPRSSLPAAVWIAAGLYVLVFTAMNWQLYRGLLVPHGDSAMYEEHLWNLTHGKGFRSYLDPGLFLGEHIQVIHLLLVPLHLLWPSQMLLELCETLALASGAAAVFWIVQRHTGSSKGAMLLAVAYLLYFPMQFLDIAVDLKTFRPTAFVIPVLLFAIDQLERGRLKTMTLLLLVALSAQEDIAIVLAPLGVWMVISSWLARRESAIRNPQSAIRETLRSEDSTPRLTTPNPPSTIESSPSPLATHHSPLYGFGIAGFAVIYLVLAVGVAIPYFRGGEPVHYTGYFDRFGQSPGEIVGTMLTRPGLVASELLTLKTALYALALLLPIGFLPLLSPGRLAVAVPMFAILCLNQVAQDPRHHFHAPLVPIVLWAAAAGAGRIADCGLRIADWRNRKAESGKRRAESGEGTVIIDQPSNAAAPPELTRDHGPRTTDKNLQSAIRNPQSFPLHFAWTSALATGLFFSLSPLGIAFWDPYSAWHWRALYVPGKRAEMFAKVVPLIPPTARVASTDFVHPRFTHHQRSYDYSRYRRKVSDYDEGVPPDTDYIVIDTRHKYSDIRRPEEVREFHEQSDEWELLPDQTDGYFIVLKRIGKGTGGE